ncbi:MAG: DNA recombination protein RmuC [Candidatus Nanosyncoccaceae bacterium]
METILIIFGVIVVAVNIGALIILTRRNKQPESLTLLKSDLNELNARIDGLKDTVHQSNTTMSDRLERNYTQTQTSMSKQMSESYKIIADVNRRLASFEDANKRVVNVADELKTLQNVLQNPKQRGVFGEFYLESVLDNVLPAGQFQMQYRFKDGETVDAVIFLDKNQLLPIDSKFSLENYNRMIEAEGEERNKLALKVKADLKARIDETAKYIRPSEGTMEFAFMFIPSESLYYDLLINNVGQGGSSRNLIEYAFRDKHVIITSPTSFMAYLQTVLQGLRSLQIEEQAKDIQVRVGQLGQHIAKYDEYMKKLGNSLGTTVNHYNNASKEFAKVDKDVVRISGGEPSIEVELIDRPQID